MSNTHEQLIRRWREAASATLEAQRSLDATFESFLAGLAPPPEQAQLDELSRLQKLEHHLLLRTLDHVRRKANGLPTAPGALE